MLIRLLLSIWIATQAVCASGAEDPHIGAALLQAEHELDIAPELGATRQEQAELDSLYPKSDPHLLWSRQGRLSSHARDLLEILSSTEVYGLRPADYGLDRLLDSSRQLTVDSTGAAWAQFDVRLTWTAIRLVTHLHFGRVDPRTAGFELSRSRDAFDTAGVVSQLAGATRVADVLTSIEPPFLHYALLKAALVRYRALAADASLTQLPAFGKRTLHPGDPYIGAAALRRLLVAVGDMEPAASPDKAADTALAPSLVAGLAHFQARHGLAADGSLGTRTYLALTTPLAQRVRQIELTLERWRWLPPFETPPIIVNIPQFRLYAFPANADRLLNGLQMPVIVGQAYPRTRTPVFVGDLRYVVFRPYWDVPRSILVREMLPQIRRDAGYLQRNNLELVKGQTDAAEVVAPTPAALAALAAGQLRLRQRPGEDNSLGLIKFVFPNAHDVYMHGTPAQRLFLQPRRAFSHGCIRVSDPVALAGYVLRDTGGGWDATRISTAMHAGTSQRVDLKLPIRVMILYGTALATEAGAVEFFDDIYGQDRKLETLLGLSPVIHAQ